MQINRGNPSLREFSSRIEYNPIDSLNKKVSNIALSALAALAALLLLPPFPAIIISCGILIFTLSSISEEKSSCAYNRFPTHVPVGSRNNNAYIPTTNSRASSQASNYQTFAMQSKPHITVGSRNNSSPQTRPQQISPNRENSHIQVGGDKTRSASSLYGFLRF